MVEKVEFGLVEYEEAVNAAAAESSTAWESTSSALQLATSEEIIDMAVKGTTEEGT